MSPRQRWGMVAFFATAMGYLEAAVVCYLRTMVDRIQPHQPDPLPDIPALALPEVAREFATMCMLLSVGWLAGRNWRGRIGFTLLAFGIWDITYYLFLVPLTGWPKSLLDWDILFLIPLPWWGPVIAPISIALLMCAFGMLSTILEQAESPIWPKPLATALASAGILLALYAFMADAIAVAPKGQEAIRTVLPQTFQWMFFIPAWLLMAVPVINMSHQLTTRYKY